MTNKLARTATAAVLGLSLIGTATPGFASSDPDAKARVEKAKKQKTAGSRYCVEQDVTGSRIPRRTCMTESQWAAEGVDIKAYVKR